MERVRIGRNDLCPCGSGRKFKRCCQNLSAPEGTGKITAFEKARTVFGDGAGLGRYSPRPALRREEHDGQAIERIPIHYSYAEPFGDAECVYCFQVEQLFLLEDGSVLPAAWLQPGMRFRLDDGSQGTVTAVEPPRVWGPPSRIPNPDGNYARRVLGRVKHKGYEVLDVTFGGTTITTTPNHLFYSASRGAWVPVSSMRPGELLRGETGETSPILAISQPRQGFVELYGIEVEELHTYFVGDDAGSALVHNGMGDCFKKPLTGMGNIGSHGPVSPSVALGSAAKWLGQGYREIAPGVFRSADGLRQFRMTTRDLLPTHGNIGPHVHFEALDALGEVIENLHLPVLP
jgi:hypothetical protein